MINIDEPSISPPASCSDLVERNLIAESGVATITVRGEEIRVWCDMDTLGGGWTLLQRRGDFGKPKNFFLKKWDDYKLGFGDPQEVGQIMMHFSTDCNIVITRITGSLL